MFRKVCSQSVTVKLGHPYLKIQSCFKGVGRLLTLSRRKCILLMIGGRSITLKPEVTAPVVGRT